jgi:hypothetical protein
MWWNDEGGGGAQGLYGVWEPGHHAGGVAGSPATAGGDRSSAPGAQRGVRVTHTYAVLKISKAAFEEIMTKLVEAGYEDQLHEDGDELVCDMHGIAVQAEE